MSHEMKILSASGQLGYGIPEDALRRGVEAKPDVIGVDMGSVDPGPYCLGSGDLMVGGEGLRRDLRLVLEAHQRTGAPVLMGSAGTAGRREQLDVVVAMIEDIARERGLSFRMAVIPADVPVETIRRRLRAGEVVPCGPSPELTEAELDRCTGAVAQMGVEPFQRAIEMGADVVVAGRACDTSMFAAVPLMRNYNQGVVRHLAKLLECTSACAEPIGRDAALGVIGDDYFTIESMDPRKLCTPVSVAAHALYEQSNPFQLEEPGGIVDLSNAKYEAVSDRKVKVSGSVWHPGGRYHVKLEGARLTGHRYIALAGIRDPLMIAQVDTVAEETRATVARVFAGTIDPGDYSLRFRMYGRDGVLGPVEPNRSSDGVREMMVIIDVVGSTEPIAKTVCGVAKQYFLHLHYPGILCNSGNAAHPFSPDFMSAGDVYEFNIYHLMPVDDPNELFPIEMRQVGAG